MIEITEGAVTDFAEGVSRPAHVSGWIAFVRSDPAGMWALLYPTDYATRDWMRNPAPLFVTKEHAIRCAERTLPQGFRILLFFLQEGSHNHV